jgi:hypothetical protein
VTWLKSLLGVGSCYKLAEICFCDHFFKAQASTSISKENHSFANIKLTKIQLYKVFCHGFAA